MLKLLFLLAVSAYEYYSTPTFGSITATAASPNSATVSVTVTGGVSMQVQASTDTSYSIHSPWFDVAASTIIGQLQPGTAYNVRVIACDAAVTAFGSCSGNTGTSGTATVTTSAAITSWTIGFSIGSTAGYNETQYPLNGRWMDADTCYCAWMTSGTIACQHNDGSGPQAAQGTPGVAGGRNVYMTTVNSAFDTFTLLNSLGNGSTTGVGYNDKRNFPAGWSDGSALKSGDVLADGNTLYWWPYRQSGTSPAYNQRYPWIVKSLDAGATWARLGQSADAAGSPASSAADSAILWSSAALALPRWVKPGGQGNAITNPVHGIDAYWYALVRNNANTSHYLARCFKLLDMRDNANWEYFGGTSGDEPDPPGGWSTNSTALTSVWDAGGGTPVFYGDPSPQYLGDFGRFVMPSEVFLTASVTDGSIRLAVWDSSNMTRWALRYSEPTKPPFNSTNGVYLNRAWNSIFMAKYTLLTTNPPTATVGILSSGTLDQQHFADPPNDMYSPFMATGTLSGVPVANHIIIADKSSRKRDGAQ